MTINIVFNVIDFSNKLFSDAIAWKRFQINKNIFYKTYITVRTKNE